MHMADALLSPAVSGVMTAVSAGAVGYSVRRISGDKLDEKKIPMMGIMGSFVFAAQMINFTIPGTGSSGHIGGGILLAAVLGPFPALLTMASVLLIQCLIFADGGLLAYGSNVFNLGVLSCLGAYMLIFRPIVNNKLNKRTLTAASMLAAVIGLQAGSFAVVLQTLASGIAELPFTVFTALMQPIHLAIGLVEGVATAAVLCYVHSVRPEILESNIKNEKIGQGLKLSKFLAIFSILSLLVAGGLSLYASSKPDGLEWSIEGAATGDLEREGEVFDAAEAVVESTAIMRDYTLKDTDTIGRPAAGIIGTLITLALACGIGLVIRWKRSYKLRNE